MGFTRPANYEIAWQRRQVEEELTKNPKEYDPLWDEILDTEATEEEGTPVLTWQQYEWEDIEEYDDFKNGVMGWLGPWNKIMENEVAQHSVINWKRKYAFRYKRDKLRKNLGNWAGNYLIGPDLYNDVWNEAWEQPITDGNIYWDAETWEPRKPKNYKTPRN